MMNKRIVKEIRIETPTSQQAKKIPILLKKHFSEQLADFWKFGLETGFRTEEILNLKFSQFFYEQSYGEPRRLFCEIESKRGHISIYGRKLSSSAEEIFHKIKHKHPKSEFLFQSYRSRNVSNKEPKPLSRHAISRAFKEVGEILGIKLTPAAMRQLALKRIGVDVKTNTVG
ncbi:TPA: tyrosine-type recombinase/integrase [Vibrio campbellii]